VSAGDGAPVVLLHGNPGSVRDFTPMLLPALASRYRVIAFDRPGHGYSERPSASGTTPAEQARLIREALRQMGVDRPIVVGHSWGGALALVYALRYPGDVAGLVVIGARAFPTASDGGPVYALARAPVIGALFRHTLLGPVGGRILERRLAAAYAPDPPDEAHRAAARALWLRPGQSAATVWDTRNLNEELRSASDRYRHITVPTAILVGEADAGGHESVTLSRAIPSAELVVLRQTGHQIPLTRPGAVTDAVRQVEARVLSGSPR